MVVALHLTRLIISLTLSHRYERKAIENWLTTADRSPLTGLALNSKTVIPNHALRTLINDGLKKKPHASFSPSPSQTLIQAETPSTKTQPGLHVEMTPVFAIELLLNPANVKLHVSATLSSSFLSKPLALIAVLDVSGSMGLASQAVDANSDGARFSRLDLLKHSMHTIIDMLRPNDILCVVAFSDRARVVFPACEMISTMKLEAKQRIKLLEPGGGTHLWAGLHAGIVEARRFAQANIHTAIVLQTDGEPSVELLPVRGIAQELKRELASDTITTTFTIHSCGFGYGDSLGSPLLRDIATIGSGTFAYVPDGSMVGTVFIHMLANLMSVAMPRVKAVINIDDKQVEVDLGGLRPGQTRDVFVPLPSLSSTITPQHFTGIKGDCAVFVKLHAVDASPRRVASVREFFVETLGSAIALMERTEDARSSRLMIQKLYEKLTQVPGMEAFTADLINPTPDKGQIDKALQHWSKWGKHYLPAIWFAHAKQEKTNFKDDSLASYATPQINELIQRGEDVFAKLPPPEASLDRYKTAAQIAVLKPVVISSMLNRNGGCFTGDSQLELAKPGEFKEIKSLRRGDVLRGGFTVRCVVRYRVDSPVIVRLRSGLGLTPWHPAVLFDAPREMGQDVEDWKWEFPMEMQGQIAKVEEEEYVWNLLLHTGHYVVSRNGVACITLGHKFVRNGVLKHPYFGTKQVIEDLQGEKDGWALGFVTYGRFNATRDKVSGIIVAGEDGERAGINRNEEAIDNDKRIMVAML